MTQPRSRFAQIGGTSLHYLEWGAPGDRAVVIWHALTGRCSDHAALAGVLAAQGHYVIAPDAPGCGLSSWSPAPETDYSLAGNARALLGLLAEKRSALIHRAVTKGLDPSVPMKDSGVPWLGEIPAHWQALKIRRLCQVKRGASPRPRKDVFRGRG